MSDDIGRLTTGDVARYCGVSRMGVLRWIRQGKLKAFTTPGGHYRITTADFREFLERYNIPIEASFFGGTPGRILVVTSNASTLAGVVSALSGIEGGYELDVALDYPSALARAADSTLALVILDSPVLSTATQALCERLMADLQQRAIPTLTLETPASPPGNNRQAGSAAGPTPSADAKILQARIRAMLKA